MLPNMTTYYLASLPPLTVLQKSCFSAMQVQSEAPELISPTKSWYPGDGGLYDFSSTVSFDFSPCVHASQINTF